MTATRPAAYSIDENLCVECGQCRRFCPIQGAIQIDMRYQHVILNDLCSGCGICEAFCPVPGAIVSAGQAHAVKNKRYLTVLRQVVWRSRWLYHQHPLMGPLTLNARRQLAQERRLRLVPHTAIRGTSAAR